MSGCGMIPSNLECFHPKQTHEEITLAYHQKFVIQYWNVERSYSKDIANDRLPKWYRGMCKTWRRQLISEHSGKMKIIMDSYDVSISGTTKECPIELKIKMPEYINIHRGSSETVNWSSGCFKNCDMCGTPVHNQNVCDNCFTK